ncbi:MAG: protein kinase [Anaerolineae bacterium]|nr:protein kinase [Anaerolineae bacterium]
MSSTSLVGRIIAGYEVLDVLGQSLMATTYRARQVSGARVVAIKAFFAQAVRQREFASRLEQEIEAVARLEHPGIVPVLGVGSLPEDNRTPYIITRYLPGGNLRQRIGRQGQLELGQIAPILYQVATPLVYAHSHGTVHRNLTPANILFDEDGRALIGDFSLPCIQEATASATGSLITEAPAYRAPELTTWTTPPTAAVDIYALGAILFEMLTGQPPYQAKTPERVVKMHIDEPVPEASRLNPNVPPAVDRVVARALAKNPDERFENAEDLAQAFVDASEPEGRHSVPPEQRSERSTLRLPALQGGQAQPSTPVPPMRGPGDTAESGGDTPLIGGVAGRDAGRPARRLAWYVYPAAFLLLITSWFVLGAIAGIWARRDISNRFALAQINAAETQTAIAYAPAATFTGVAAATATWQEAAALYTATAEAAATATPTATFTPSPSPTATPIGGTRGKIAYVSEQDGDPEIYILDLLTGEKIQVTRNNVPDGAPEWSPDGTMLAFASNESGTGRHIYIVDSIGENRRQITDGVRVDDNPFWLADNATLVFNSSEGGRSFLRQVTLTGEEANIVQHPGAAPLMDVSPDGRTFTFFGADVNGVLEMQQILRGAAWTERVAITRSFGDVQWMRYSADRRRIVFTATAVTPLRRSQLYISDPSCPIFNDDVACVVRITEDDRTYSTPVFSPDGRLILVTIGTGNNRNLFALDFDGTIVQQITDSVSASYDGIWQP